LVHPTNAKPNTQRANNGMTRRILPPPFLIHVAADAPAGLFVTDRSVPEIAADSNSGVAGA
jgi:hypothetical protein